MKQLYTFIFLLLSFIGFLITACFVSTKRALLVDQYVLSSMQQIEHDLLTKLMTIITHLGSYYAVFLVFLITAIVLYFDKKRNAILLLSSIVVVTPIVNMLLKNIFMRVRPEVNHLIDIGGYSFPSGHTMHAVSIYGMMLYILLTFSFTKRIKYLIGSIILFFIIAIAFSRIYLRVHYFTDVIGGIFASICLITLLQLLFSYLSSNKKHLKHR